MPRRDSALLIVLMVLGVLALLFFVSLALLSMIVLPRMVKAGNKAKEVTLKANVLTIRNAVEQFYLDTGAYPASLEDLTRAKTDPPKTGNGKAPIPAGSYHGPYLTAPGGIGGSRLPINPYVKPTDPNYGKVSTHWHYQNGVVHPTVPTVGKTSDGTPYTAL